MSSKQEELKILEESIEQMPYGIGVFDIETAKPLVLNSGFYQLFGYTKETYEQTHADSLHSSGKLIDQLLPERSANEFRLNGKAIDYPLAFEANDHTIHWANMNVTQLKISGERYAVASFHDITALKRAEEAEHEKNLMLTHLLNDLPGGVAIFKMSDRLECTYFSDGFAFMTGRSRAQVEGMLADEELLKQGIPMEHYHQFVHALKQEHPIGKTLSYTYNLFNVDGEVSFLHVTAVKIKEEAGVPVYYCIFTLPTGETALYRNIVEDSAIGVYVGDRKTRLNYYANAAMGKLCGIDIHWIAGKKLEEFLEHYGKQELISQEQIDLLTPDTYHEFSVKRNGHYLAVKAKAISWNHTDSYILYLTDVSTEYEIRLELERNLLKEEALVDAIPGGTAIYHVKKDGTTKMAYCSDGLCKLLEYDRDVLLQAKDIQQFVYPEDLEATQEKVQNAIDHGNAIDVIYRLVTKSGQVLLTRLDAKVMPNAELEADDLAVLYAVHAKILDASRIALQEQQYYRKVLNMTGTAYFEWDRENGFYASEEYCKYQISEGGYDSLMGTLPGIETIYPDDRAVMKHYTKSLAETEHPKSVTVRMKMRDGHYQWTEVVAYAEMNEDGGFHKLAGVLRDVDKEWIARNRKLQDALDLAEQANRAKTAFLSRVSHDMRTPLNGILGLTEFLKDSVKDPQAKKDVQQLEISGQYLLNLINDTLDVSRIENGKLELHPSVQDGKETFTHVANLARPSTEAKQQTFTVNAKGVVDTPLYIDVGRVEQIIMNIIGNAVKFTPEHGTIVCDFELLEETETTITDRIRITDNGIGMRKEFLPKLFDAFSQADETSTNARSGTGLGMAITKQLVDLMGGTISVESELGKGTSFTLVLPFPKATQEQIQQWKASTVRQVDHAILHGKRVLLCEDHPLNREIAIRLLNNKGVLVDVAENGKEGLEHFEASSPNYYDAILMDIRMPVMDGLDATRAIRQLKRSDATTVPIIAMTGNSFEEDVMKTKDAGMNAHLSKPVDSVKLFETLIDQMSQRHTFHRPKILIVEDVEMNRTIIKEAIQEDYDVLEAENGNQALEVLKQNPDIDGVITDLIMDGMNGLQLIEAIRSNVQNEHLAIVLNTFYEEYQEVKKAYAQGANACIYKPNTPKDILEKLHFAFQQVNATASESRKEETR